MTSGGELIPFDMGPACQMSGEPFRNAIPRLPPDHPARIAAVNIQELIDPVLKEWATASRVFKPATYEVISDTRYVGQRRKPPQEECRVYWGSHGCDEPRGHPGNVPHRCDCCECVNHPDPDPDNPGNESSCVAAPPYYGPDTRFFGEDAVALGLPS
jgi:hypothetical protein